MRKRGKYEAVPAARKKSNNSLMRAYLMSLLSLLLTCAMFMGTTAAWFTAEVVNAGNQIQVGVLSVDLFHNVEEGEEDKWISLKTDTAHKVFGAGEEVWKPGSSDLQVLKVLNDGEMLLDYQVTLLADFNASTDAEGNLLAADKLEELASHFAVYSIAGENREFDSEKWSCVGTLQDILQGKPLYVGSLEEDAEEVFSVALVLDTEVNNDFMGHKLELYLKLTAYQGAEDFTAVSGETALREALQTGGDILLLNDITVREPLAVGADSVILFNGNDLTFEHEQEDAQYAFRLTNGVHLTLEAVGSTISVENGLVLVAEHTEAAVTIHGGTYITPGVTGENSGLIHIPEGEGVKLDLVMQNAIYNMEQSGWAVYFGDEEKGELNIQMSGCTISSGHGIRTAPAGMVEISDSSIHAVQGLAIQAWTADGVKITDCSLSAAYPGAELNETDYIYTVTTQNGAAVEIDGGSVLTGTNMDALAILAGVGDISARNCTVDSEAIFEHEDALGVVTLNG